jgi:hypothetical protein
MRNSATLAGVSYQGESDRALNAQGRWLKGWPESRRGHEASASTGKVCPFLTSLLSTSDERRTPSARPPMTALRPSFCASESEVRVGSDENGISACWLPVNPSLTVAAELASRCSRRP